MVLGQILLILAFILFVLAAIGVPSSRFNLLAAGLAVWVLAILVGGTNLAVR
jgi:hypothetical protein